MSKILDKLKEAEAHREHVIAERKRLEAEADAALAARDRDENTGRTRRQAPVTRGAAAEPAQRG